MLRTVLLKLYILFFMLACSASASCSLPPQKHTQAVILQYHHVSDLTPSSTSVSPQRFIEHLNLIQQQGFQILPLVGILQTISQGKSFSQKTLAITFDDGYLSIFENAFPELKKRNIPFTIFVSPEAIDKQFGNSLSWQQLALMQKHGATISNHSYRHQHLLQKQKNESKNNWLQRVKEEIEFTQNRLFQQLGSKHKLFAYPYGEFNFELKALLKEMDYWAFSQQSGPISSSSDPQALPRFPASGPYANLETLKVKINSLAFNILNVEPISRILNNEESAPTLKLQVAIADVKYQMAQCFYLGQAINTHVEKRKDTLIIRAHAMQPLQPGRSRYNCTAPSLSLKHHYWYSMPFISLPVETKEP